jgi:steroid 5-alpha reductase family enzyme
MTFINLYLIGAAVIFGFMVVLWLVSLALKNSSIVDIFWGFGFVLSAWLYFFLTPEGFLLRKIILLALVTIWGLRLTIHILTRNWGKPEDFRYQKWRAEAGPSWWIRSLFKVFLLQGLLMWLISAPLLGAQFFQTRPTFTWVIALAILVWLIGFFFEMVGDSQLARFRAEPANKGKLLNTGVWQLTRHPNYFGDAAQWWGFYLLALIAGGWWTVFSPILMTLFLIQVSGVALLEKTLAETKPGYKEYMASTSAFIPWFPKHLTNK